ncbi:MAG: hypothetical protein NC181_02050 [Clostridium sp.]|nr:hypothetical protein [Clostridium sp.]MCM1444089.1 hypothetical protein [Candidatus Amulumruptor caecigallinarius]
MAIKDFKIENWEQKTLFMKILTIVGFIISASVIILSFLQIFDIWDKAINIFEPLLGVLMLIQTIENWNSNKKTAYYSLFVAIFIFIVAIFILF